jgi:hypothetical protein
MFTIPWACNIPKMTFLEFPQKSLLSKRRKTAFLAYSTRLLTPETQIEKTEPSG